jgi:hypothetical protein
MVEVVSWALGVTDHISSVRQPNGLLSRKSTRIYTTISKLEIGEDIFTPMTYQREEVVSINWEWWHLNVILHLKPNVSRSKLISPKAPHSLQATMLNDSNVFLLFNWNRLRQSPTNV